jgi:squalene-hopene/tetraprenyl-beta-curcumene cyclase
MKKIISAGVCGLVICVLAGLSSSISHAAAASTPTWSGKAAAAYLDQRQDWWMTWPTAARDHGTYCVSCHTALPYALARPALRQVLGESGPSATEIKQVESVTKRVRMWKDVEPFYPDQLRGLPKTSESRGTEAILNAVVLVSRDAQTHALSADARLAFDNLWALQMKSGDLTGAWAWLNFHNEPWEADGSPAFGASLAAIAIGTAPGGYAASPEIQDRVKALRGYLQKANETQHLLNRVMLLWASGALPDTLTHDQQQSTIDALVRLQQPDGGWSVTSLGAWKRQDASQAETASDGYATGLICFALQVAGVPRTRPELTRGLAWLATHQDPATGIWSAASLNKKRDPASDAGRFMSDAATAYAVLALTRTQ